MRYRADMQLSQKRKKIERIYKSKKIIKHLNFFMSLKDDDRQTDDKTMFRLDMHML